MCVAAIFRKRDRSFLLRAAIELAPEGLRIEPFDLAEIPLYNGDLDRDDIRPAAVERFKGAIAEADAILIATPEYNYGLPGVLKNAIDWASRPGFKSPLAGKAAVGMGAAPGVVSTARAQEHLKLSLLSTLAVVMPHPGVQVNHAADKFDAEGSLTDEKTRAFVARFLTEFRDFARINVPRSPA
jgi:chromate reductase